MIKLFCNFKKKKHTLNWPTHELSGPLVSADVICLKIFNEWTNILQFSRAIASSTVEPKAHSFGHQVIFMCDLVKNNAIKLLFWVWHLTLCVTCKLLTVHYKPSQTISASVQLTLKRKNRKTKPVIFGKLSNTTFK